MPKFSRYTLSLILGMLLGGAAAAAEPAQEFTLKNGLKVIVREDHRAPTVVNMVWYRLGSMDEVNGVTGVAHVLEHMMFKGTRRLRPGEFSARVAALGGEDNAFTSKDFTAYFETVGSRHLEAVMALEADRMANLRISPAEFSREIRVVMEERRWRTDDAALALVQEALYATAFAAHPYRHPVVGWMDDLQHMTAADAQAWHRDWYAPNNATIVVAGDVTLAQVRRLAEKYFAAIPRKLHAPTRPQNEPLQRGIKRVAVSAPAENPFVALAFKVPPLQDAGKDHDAFALEVLAAVLDGYDNARLSARLVRTDKVANAVSAAYTGVGRGPALFVLDGTPAAGTSVAQLEARLREEIARIASEGVAQDELRRVKAQLVASQVYKRDALFEQAVEIGTYEMSGLSHRDIDRVITQLKRVTPEQVQEVARKYFTDAGLTVATLSPLPLTEKKTPPPELRH